MHGAATEKACSPSFRITWSFLLAERLEAQPGTDAVQVDTGLANDALVNVRVYALFSLVCFSVCIYLIVSVSLCVLFH